MPIRRPRHVPSSRRTDRPAALLFVLLMLSPAWAGGGLTLAVLATPPIDRPLVLDVRVSYPVARFEHVEDTLELALRADVLADFATTPVLTIGTSLSDSGDPTLAGLRRYLAIGAGLGFAPPPLDGTYPLFYGAVGARLPLTGALAAVVELNVGGTARFVGSSTSLGLAYRFGGVR